jgi:putative endonuclease
MAKHNETGARGEQIAGKFLQAKGYDILHSNWRHGRAEVDLIALQEGALVFVEVKTRRGLGFGYPEESVDARKESFLRKAAEAFLDRHPAYYTLRFDIVAVLLQGEVVQEIVHWEDVF